MTNFLRSEELVQAEKRPLYLLKRETLLKQVESKNRKVLVAL